MNDVLPDDAILSTCLTDQAFIQYLLTKNTF